MSQPFTAEEGAVVTFALALRVDSCDARIAAMSVRPLPDAAQQCSGLSYWIRERLLALRTRDHARQVFWA